MISALVSWYQHDFILGAIATVAGLLVISPMLISKRTRQWVRRALDADIEFIGLVVLMLAIVLFAIYNNIAH